MSGLGTNKVLNTETVEVKNKIPDVSGLTKKTGYDATILDIEKKYLTASNYNKFTKEILDTKIKEKKLTDQSDISNLVKKIRFKQKTCKISEKSRTKCRTR